MDLRGDGLGKQGDALSSELRSRMDISSDSLYSSVALFIDDLFEIQTSRFLRGPEGKMVKRVLQQEAALEFASSQQARCAPDVQHAASI